MDADKVIDLLTLIEKTSQTPAFKGLQGLAMRTLVEENEAAQEELDELLKADAEEKAKEEEKAAKEAKALAEKEAKANSAPSAKGDK